MEEVRFTTGVIGPHDTIIDKALNLCIMQYTFRNIYNARSSRTNGPATVDANDLASDI